MTYSRRFFTSSAAAAIVAAAMPRAWADTACEVFTPSRQSSTTPAAALQLLKEGNERFVAGRSVNCDLIAQVRATASEQAPFAAVLGCMDSRVPPELVFDQRIGDIFAIRIAGNFVDTDIIGSLEYAAKVVSSKAILVLGHSDCGAIKGAIDRVELGNLTSTLQHFAPAIKAVGTVAGGDTSKNKALVQAVADANAKLAAKMLVDNSEVLRGLVESKDLVIAAAMHDVHTGRVTFFA